jgi:uncharacterized protein
MPGKNLVIDADRHIMEPLSLWDQYLDARFRSRIVATEDSWPFVASIDGMPTVDTTDFAGTPFRSDERYFARYRDAIDHAFDAASNIRAMDEEGVDIAVHFPGTVGLHTTWRDGLDPELAVAIAVAYNNWVADFCAKDPERMKAITLLPVQDMGEAVAELRRSVRHLGFVGAFVRPNPLEGRTLSDPYYFPLYEEASRLGVPIMVHEAAATTLPQVGRGRISRFGRHIACHPMEQMLAVLNFCGDGILAEFPELNVAFMEAGCGWLPFWLERMDEHWEHFSFGKSKAAPKPPSDYFKEQCFVSSESEERLINTVIEHVGAHVIVTASDYPHPDEISIAEMRDRTDIPKDALRQILCDNPARLYHLDIQG